MVMLHLFTFDPQWIQSQPSRGTDTLFYDGTCGLCHRAVRFILAEDQTGTAFRFAPLGGETFQRAVSSAQQMTLPDSLVIRTFEGVLLMRAKAVRRLCQRLGGIWRLGALISRVLPVFVWDGLYDLIARTRHRMFARPKESCPILPQRLRARFEP
jgi:predicted DCC family thiol-disulfide oxidoreductase YuxK